MTNKLWRVGTDELALVEEAINTGLDGSMTKDFEQNFAKRFNVDYAIAVNSGTSALHASLLALGIGPGDEVIVPPLSFVATAYAPLYVGAVPIFSDIDEATFNLDPDKIEKNITSRTKAIIAVSIYGLPPDLLKITEIAKRYNLKVIEDNAQCVLGECDGKLAGTFGDISIFSFQRSKHLTAGDGGMIITGDEMIAEKCRKFSDLGYRTLTAKSITNEDIKNKIQHYSFKRHELIGYNFRMPDLCSAVCLSQLKRIDELVDKRIAIAKCYDEAVSGCSWLRPQAVPLGYKHSYWSYAMKIDKNETGVLWDKFREVFISNSSESFYGAWSLSYLEPSLHKMIFSDQGIEYLEGLCPTAESLQPNLIQLKTNFDSLEYARRQSEALRKTIETLD